MRKCLILTVATGVGSGFLPLVPGTWGTLLAAGLYIILFIFISLSPWLLYVLSLLLFLVGVWSAGKAEQYFETRDPCQVVIDEIAGYFVAVMFFIPSLQLAVISFILFRLFDILKPFPLRRLEKMPEGWGVMLDDIGAGLYAALILALLTGTGIM